jgi:hypothetical protein
VAYEVGQRIAKQLKFFLLTGSKFHYRSARLTGLRLEPAEDAAT